MSDFEEDECCPFCGDDFDEDDDLDDEALYPQKGGDYGCRNDTCGVRPRFNAPGRQAALKIWRTRYHPTRDRLERVARTVAGIDPHFTIHGNSHVSAHIPIDIVVLARTMGLKNVKRR